MTDDQLLQVVLDELAHTREQLTGLSVIAAETNSNVGHLSKHLEDLVNRIEDHSVRINESASDIARWKAMEIDGVAKTVADWQSKITLILGVSGFVGVGGFVSMVALLIREFSK